MSAALVPWNPRPARILWLDFTTGRGINPAGRGTTGIAYTPNLAGVLDLAWREDCDRVMLTGKRPPAGWLLGGLPSGWVHGAHHLDHETPVGRYTNGEGRRFEVRRAAEWFGAGDYTPAQAAAGWHALTTALAEAVPDLRPLASPGATGREAWLRSRSFDHGQPITPPQVSAEIAELLRETSGQHRIELFAEPANRPDKATDQLWLLDGRLMYAACMRELGAGPATMLDATDAERLFDLDPYARARYQVRVTIPAWWEAAGILPLKSGDDARDGWEYPHEAGRTFTTWADAAEVWLAAYQFKWPTTFLAGMMFTPGRPLDTWAARLLRAVDKAGASADPAAPLVRAGVRWMLLHSIGAFHSTGRTETTITPNPMTRPAGDGWGAPSTENYAAVWRRRIPLDGRAAAMSHPEWSAQVWGRARARVLWAPTAVKGTYAGALTIPGAQLVSIYGDAVMTTRRPEWAAPDYDDGKPGRLRVKGYLPDLDAAGGWPTTGRRRDRLMHAAEANTNKGESNETQV